MQAQEIKPAREHIEQQGVDLKLMREGCQSTQATWHGLSQMPAPNMALLFVKIIEEFTEEKEMDIRATIETFRRLARRCK